MVKKYHQAPEPLACYDCGLLYSDPSWIEAVIPNDVWAKITPSHHAEGGILCINCIAKRCVEIGLEDVPVMLAAGPLVAMTDEQIFKELMNSDTLANAILRKEGYDPDEVGKRLAEFAREQIERSRQR